MKKACPLGLMLCLCLFLCWVLFSPSPGSIKLVQIGKEPLPYSEEMLYAQLFDPENKIEIRLDMPDGELLKLMADFKAMEKSPIYRRGDLTVTVTAKGKTTAYTIPDVGVRMKGNTSRTQFYSKEAGIYNAIHLKIDFQETFDDPLYYGIDSQVWENRDARKLRKERTFATLEKLELRWNKCNDSTYLKESYAYRIFRSEGVMAPQVNLCSFHWSGVHMGVYTVNEPVDEAFLQKRLPEAALGGDLYKLGWTNKGADFRRAASIGSEDKLGGNFYTYDLKTNQKTSDHGHLKNLIGKLNAGVMTKERFGELVDAAYFVRFAAVSYILGNPDDLRNNYNNCYLYFRADNGKALFIPYDYDRCLGVIYEWDPYGDGMVGDLPDSLRQVNGRQNNPLFLYSVADGGFYLEEYTKALDALLQNPLLLPESFAASFRSACALYAGDVQPDREFCNAGGRSWDFSLNQPENLSFHQYITAKTETLRQWLATKS